MSVPEASGQNLNPAPTMPGRRPDFPTNLDGTLGPNTAHDPLLQSGSFIDATTTTPTPTSNGKTRKEAKKPKKTHEKSASAEPSGSGPENPDSGGGRGKRRGMMEPLESWLPQGWTVEEKVRTNGATAGSTDRYYFDPVSGRRFRSKIEVLYFLETGTLKGKKTPENSSAGKRPAEGSGSQKLKKSSTKPKSPALNFDFVNVPEKVVWVLQDSAVGSWTPFIANVKVPESTVKEWEAAFTVVSSRK